jgi:hypothetical protein
MPCPIARGSVSPFNIWMRPMSVPTSPNIGEYVPMSRNMRSAATRFSERISDSRRMSSSMRCASTPSTTRRSPFTRNGSFVESASGSREANPFILAWRARWTSSSATTFGRNDPVMNMRLIADAA